MHARMASSVIDHACVQLCVLHAGAPSLTGCQVVAIHCDWCLSGKDGDWTSGGFGAGLCRGDTCCKERELSMKSNRVGTTDVLGMSCTLGLVMDL